MDFNFYVCMFFTLSWNIFASFNERGNFYWPWSFSRADNSYGLFGFRGFFRRIFRRLWPFDGRMTHLLWGSSHSCGFEHWFDWGFNWTISSWIDDFIIYASLFLIWPRPLTFNLQIILIDLAFNFFNFWIHLLWKFFHRRLSILIHLLNHRSFYQILPKFKLNACLLLRDYRPLILWQNRPLIWLRLLRPVVRSRPLRQVVA